MKKLHLVEFSGPYSWNGSAETTSIFDAEISKNAGIYLWTVSYGDAELIYYVGETGRNFAIRMLEHFQEHCSGGYHLYNPSLFRLGQKECLWPGRYDPTQRTSIGGFLQQASELFPVILELAVLYRFFLAPLNGTPRLRKRIEAAIATHLYHQAGIIGSFQDRGIRYASRRVDEQPEFAEIRCSHTLLGLPEKLQV